MNDDIHFGTCFRCGAALTIGHECPAWHSQYLYEEHDSIPPGLPSSRLTEADIHRIVREELTRVMEAFAKELKP